MAERPVRVTVVMTHPVQYFAPWFRHIAARRPDVALTVLYAVRPTPEAQAGGYATAFEWDVPLLEGYDARVLAAEPWPSSLLASGFSRVDAPDLARALAEAAPDAVVVPGWHAAVYLRAIDACRAMGVPVLYRGDSHLGTAPRGVRRLAWRARTKWRLSRFDAWLAVGTRSREYLAAFGAPEPLVFASPHAVDNARFEAAASRHAAPGARRALRERFGLSADAFVVLIAGRLTAAKRPLDPIEAAAAAGPGVEVLVAGTGEAEADCRARAAALGVRVAFAGFVNQTHMPEVFAAADCLAMPSERETWGLVVNEALASGRPVIVSDGVGAAPDLVARGPAGLVVPVGDVGALSGAIARMRERTAADPDLAGRCREAVAPHSFDRATDGLVAACARLARLGPARLENRARPTRVLALCGHMVIPGGLERMTVSVLAALRRRGAGAHAVVNGWESSAVVALVERAGVSWSTGRYYATFSRHPSAAAAIRMGWDTLVTSAGTLRAARTLRATHVLVPEANAVLRNWPALAWLRLRGIPVVMRLGNAPPPGDFYRRLWRWVIAPVVSRFVANSRFIAGEVAATGIAAARVEVVLNAPTVRGEVAGPAPATPQDPWRVVYVGQVIPPKGVDVLLDAVALVRGRGVPATLEIVGDVDGWEAPAYAGYRQGLRARAAAPDLAGAVTFAGYQTDVAARLARAAAHCCPSLPAQREGLAGVVLEAKAAAVPSVVAPTGSLPELVEHGVDGWIAADTTAPALADALHAALADPVARAAAGAAARASLARFSPERFEDEWARVFGLSGPARAAAGGAAEARA
ncbi:MAG: glycosyltransferase family 4 protein [Vicinamibacterales bacterium]